MDDRDIDGVKSASSELKTLFNEFNSAHDAVVLTFEDGDAIETAVRYYDDVFGKYRSIMNKIRTFTADPERVLEAQHTTCDSPMTSSIVQALNLPRIEIAKFSGDVREYHTFMTVFKQCVESVTQGCRSYCIILQAMPTMQSNPALVMAVMPDTPSL